MKWQAVNWDGSSICIESIIQPEIIILDELIRDALTGTY